MVDAVLPFEEFGRALVPGPFGDTILISEIIARFGSPALKERWLPDIASGAARISFAHAEAGSGALPTKLIAARQNDRWFLSGSKILVPGAEDATALAVSARLPDGGAGLFLCPLDGGQITVGRNTAIDPNSLLCRVEFQHSKAIPLGALALERLLETSATAAAAQMVGIADAALEMAVAYAKQRTQFNRPIGSFQAIKHKCADMLVATETSRSAAYYAGWALAEDDPSLRVAVSTAKAACGDARRLVCNECLQIHGGVGFTWEFDAHFYLKRGKLLEFSFGDASWHRERVVQLIMPPANAA